MRLRRVLQVLNWIWADLFHFVVLNDSFFKLQPFGGKSFLCKAKFLKRF